MQNHKSTWLISLENEQEKSRCALSCYMCFLHLHVGGAFDSHVQFLEMCHVHHDTDVRNKSGWTVEFLEAFMENWVKEFDFAGL